MTLHALLPEGFENLEPFVAVWAGATTQARFAARNQSSMEEIRCFYDAMTAKAEAAFTYLEQFPMEQLPPQAGVLFRLLLALAQASMAIEIHNAVRPAGMPWPTSLVIERAAQPYG